MKITTLAKKTISQQILVQCKSFTPHFKANCLIFTLKPLKTKYVKFSRHRKLSKVVRIYRRYPVYKFKMLVRHSDIL